MALAEVKFSFPISEVLYTIPASVLVDCCENQTVQQDLFGYRFVFSGNPFFGDGVNTIKVQVYTLDDRDIANEEQPELFYQVYVKNEEIRGYEFYQRDRQTWKRTTVYAEAD
jgi:hypothetical protein